MMAVQHAHNSGVIIQYLRGIIIDKIIANNGNVLWPIRFLDLTPLGYFFWGIQKTKFIHLYHQKTYKFEPVRNTLADIIRNSLRRVV